MAITRVGGQASGETADAAASVSHAFPSAVATGNLIVVLVARWSQAVNDPPVLADISKSAGTATLGSFALDSVRTQTFSPGEYIHSAIYSAIVASGGSLTVQVAGNAGDYWMIAATEYASDTGFDSERLEGSNGAVGSSTTPATGNVASAGAAAFCGLVGTVFGSSQTHTPDAAFTDIFESENGAAHQTGNACDRIVSTGTTDEAAWSIPSAPWAAALAVYRQGPSPAPLSWFDPIMVL